MMEKPYSQSCENNKNPILNILRNTFKDSKSVLEVGSGTGQHAVYFAEMLPHLVWQPSDKAENLVGLRLWINEAKLSNIMAPVELDVTNTPWNVEIVDAIFSANTFHIMSKNAVECFFEGIESALAIDAKLCVYGPFNYKGKYTSESNESFDKWLKKRDRNSGIRDFEWVCTLAESHGLKLVKDHEMPVNNRLLEWIKVNNYN